MVDIVLKNHTDVFLRGLVLRGSASGTHMEVVGLDEGTIIDLTQIERRRRIDAWCQAAPMLLPNLSVRFDGPSPPTGNLAHVSLKGGGAWLIQSSPADVYYQAPKSRTEAPDRIALCVQVHGSTVITHNRIELNMTEGDVSVIDEKLDFTLSSSRKSTILIVQLPRPLVQAKAPYLDNFIANKLHKENSATAFLRDVLMSVLKNGPGIAEDRKESVLLSIIYALISSFDYKEHNDARRHIGRISAALAYLDANLRDWDLTATEVARAQVISRRRLDQIMIDATGLSISEHIWAKRLESASKDLIESHNKYNSVTDIAFDNGFKNSAHFARLFKKAYGMPPSQWRRLKSREC